MIDRVAAWRVGEIAVTLEVKRWPDTYRLRWGSEKNGPQEPEGVDVEAGQRIETFERCSDALFRAQELGVRISIRPNFDDVCERRGPPRIDAETGCPSWNRPNDYSPFYWFVYLDGAGAERIRDERDWILIRRELWERCDRQAIDALKDGLVPVHGIGGRLKFARHSDPGLEPWYRYLRLSESYRDQMVYSLDDCQRQELPDEWALGHEDDDPILELPI